MADPRETGWYRDPRHPDRHRFWDGKRWQSQSEHLHACGDDPVVTGELVTTDRAAERP